MKLVQSDRTLHSNGFGRDLGIMCLRHMLARLVGAWRLIDRRHLRFDFFAASGSHNRNRYQHFRVHCPPAFGAAVRRHASTFRLSGIRAASFGSG